MSGTSADGVDAVVACFEALQFRGVEASLHLPYPADLKSRLIRLGRDAAAPITLPELAELDAAVAEHAVEAVLGLLELARLKSEDIQAIGSHGQTIFHAPRQARNSLQIGDPNRIAALTRIHVAADFRRMDIALGGEGAPLVPGFHQTVFAGSVNTAVVNVGGIANITLLPANRDGPVTGFDCGPGNALMDEWVNLHLAKDYDAQGQLAASGQIDAELLSHLLAEPYFQRLPPKSTGRAEFNLDWLAALAPKPLSAYAVADVQATLCELTAKSIAACVTPAIQRLLVCGGGAFNQHLMHRLGHGLPQLTVSPTDALGLPAQWVEAAAFAWLAHQRVNGLHGNLPAVTGASQAAVLGGLFSPGR